MSEITLDRGDAGRVVNARPGDVVVIGMTETPTSGYRWELASSGAASPEEELPGTAPVLQLAGDEFQPERGALGAGGIHIFRFVVVAPGSASVRLVHRRRWESGVDPVETWEATLRSAV